jgi:hypothetical protein
MRAAVLGNVGRRRDHKAFDRAHAAGFGSDAPRVNLWVPRRNTTRGRCRVSF